MCSYIKALHKFQGILLLFKKKRNMCISKWMMMCTKYQYVDTLSCATCIKGQAQEYHTDFKSRKQPVLLKVPNYTLYITEIMKDVENFDLASAVGVSIRCGACGENTYRLIQEQCCTDGTVLVRCMWCEAVNVMVDHINIFNMHWANGTCEGVRENLLRASTQYGMRRIDKDTVIISKYYSSELVPAAYSSECIKEHYIKTKLYHSAEVKLVLDNKSLSLLAIDHQMLISDHLQSQWRIPEYVSEYHWLVLTDFAHIDIKKLKYYTSICDERSSEAADSKSTSVSDEVCADEARRRRLGYMYGHDVVYDLGLYSWHVDHTHLRTCVNQLLEAWTCNTHTYPGRAALAGSKDGSSDLAGSRDEGLGFTGAKDDGSGLAGHIVYSNIGPAPPRANPLLRVLSLSLAAACPDASQQHVDLTPLHPIQLYACSGRPLAVLWGASRCTLPERYDGRTVYILSCLLTGAYNEPLARDVYRQLRLPLVSFPIDAHLSWGPSTKRSMSLPLCHRILLTWMNGGTWAEAFSHVPDAYLQDRRPRERGRSPVQPYRRSPLTDLDG